MLKVKQKMHLWNKLKEDMDGYGEISKYCYP